VRLVLAGCVRGASGSEMIKVELHVHTNSSKDSLLGKFTLLAMCKLRGISCLAITDHDKLENAILYSPFFLKHGINIIPGEEIMTQKGEIIGLFLKQCIPPGLTPEETVKEIRAQGGLVYIPHPYDKTRFRSVLDPESIDCIKSSIHIMECHNGRNSDCYCTKVQNAMCEKWGFLKAVGSDAHTFLEMGRNYLLMSSFSSPEEFLECLKEAKCIINRRILGIYGITRLVKAIKMLVKGDVNGLYRAFHRRYCSSR
jgi:predicted metal-dependent phosphoesterase TrpH